MRKYIERHRPTVVQFLKFGTVGAAGFVLDNAFVYLGIYLGMGRVAAGFFAFPFIVSFTWVGNRLFTFRDKRAVPVRQQWARFAAVCAVGLIFNRGTYTYLVMTVPVAHDYPTLGLLAGTAAGMFFNFFASKKLVFR